MLATLSLDYATSVTAGFGDIEGIICGNNSASSQWGQLKMNVFNDTNMDGTADETFFIRDASTASVDSTTAQTFTLTSDWNSDGAGTPTIIYYNPIITYLTK